MSSRIHLHRLLFISLSTVFVALLVEFTGEFHWLWPLYGIPIIVAALTYHASGAVLMSAITAALLAFHLLDANVPMTSQMFAEAAVGIGVFLVAGLIVGVLMQREQARSTDLERTSVYDPLTGLYSKSYFSTRLEEETHRHTRYGGTMSLALVELDDLETFTETFGTRRAALLLEHLAEITKIAVRNTDVLAHYREGTFALILPHCSEENALAVAKRIEELVAATEFEGDELEPVTRHTVTTAVACYPTPAADAQALLDLTESQLRQSKGVDAAPSRAPRPANALGGQS